MLRYLKGSTSGSTAAKRKSEGESTERSEEKKKKNKIYDEQKRSRKWQEKWLHDDKGAKREWLEYDPEKAAMFCKVCKKNSGVNTSSSFVDGNTVMKLETIKKHEKSAAHAKCMEIDAAKRNPAEQPAAELLRKLNEAQLQKMNNLFNNAHAIAKKARPYSDFEWMCELDRKKGVNVGRTYTNEKAAKTFISYIAEAEREPMVRRFSEAKFFSVMTDGSTDKSVQEEEIVYARCAHKGQIDVYLLDIKAVDKADATTISETIIGVVKDKLQMRKDEWKTKLVAVTTDGASVNTGKKTGVVQRIRQMCDHDIQGVHCMAHRLELAFKDTIADSPPGCYKALHTLLSGLYVFYHQSPHRRGGLKAVFKKENETEYLPLRLCDTRWVQHFYHALDNFFKGYKCIIKHLEKVKDPRSREYNNVDKAKAVGFLKHATSPVTMRFACFLHDVLYHLTCLSCALQKTHVSVAELHRQLETTMAVLQKYRTGSGPMLTKLEEANAPFDGTYDLSDGHDGVIDTTQFDTSRKKMIDNILARIEVRFSEINSQLVAATGVIDLFRWPDKKSCDDYGNDKIQCLITHYKPILVSAGFDAERIPDEWTILKNSVYGAPDWKDTLAKGSWEELNRAYGHQCQNILGLVDLLLSIPASTAICERGFSQMKIIKSDSRNRLESGLGDLMFIKEHSANIDTYNPARAIDLWLNSGKRSRRVDYMEHVGHSSGADAEEREEDPETEEEDSETESWSLFLEESDDDN